MEDKKIKPLEEMTLKELGEEAKALGMADVSAFNSRAQLLSVINTLNAKKIVEETKTPTPRAETKSEVAHYTSKAERMKKHLESQPRVRVWLSLEGKEKKGTLVKKLINGQEVEVREGTWVSPCLNGYKWWVPKGVGVDVPEQIAGILGQGDIANTETAQEYRLDNLANKIDPVTGLHKSADVLG